jgi:hypothetical protein
MRFTGFNYGLKNDDTLFNWWWANKGGILLKLPRLLIKDTRRIKYYYAPAGFIKAIWFGFYFEENWGVNYE